MSFQAYMNTIEAKTGKTADDFRSLAREHGLATYRDIVAWLKTDFGLGHGHANAMAHVVLGTFDEQLTVDERVAAHFVRGKAGWREPFDALIATVREFGTDVSLSPSDSYISILRQTRKFAVVQVTSKRLDIGIKLEGAPVEGRFEPAGTWNRMVTHRVRISDPAQIDADVVSWLRQAYERA